MPLPARIVAAVAALPRLFHQGDHRSLPLLLKSHALLITHGLFDNAYIFSSIISAYSHLRLPSLALLVFRQHHSHHLPDLIVYNSLLSAFSRNHLFCQTLSFFRRLRLRLSPDHFSLSIAAKAAAELLDLPTGRFIHSLSTRLGYNADTVLSNSLMLMYFRCECPRDARVLFDGLPLKSVASWNTLISELAAVDALEICQLVKQMQTEGIKPDSFTVSTLLTTCGADNWSQKRGKELHCFILRNSFNGELDFHINTCLIDMYCKARRMDLAKHVFNEMELRNVVAWTAMIAAHVEHGQNEEAIKLFREMVLSNGLLPNKITLVSVLPAVASLASLPNGKQMHGFAIRLGFNTETSLNNALIDMYSKCGSIDSARCIFDDESWKKDVISRRSMISCYGIHGRGDEAIALFRKMTSLDFKFDHITSLSVLSACAKSGLAIEGLEIYNALVKNHGITPTVEICSCMVDMLGRAGMLDHALHFIQSMQFTPSASVWGALLGASVIHNDEKLQQLSYDFLLKSEPDNPSSYVSGSNLYALSQKWDIVDQFRARMKEQGLKKSSGSSWITS
ncbi:pentatricopeptide repeat-containing protein At3g12770-like [Zingiber officinale]|uniref:Pentatricopeptide repeat-containing protein n=1 Tax=Zingiber officinale TaxID=94328 RepID=A0A8J5KS01_ZINOF|nr:pentatricopeptide repeat-containing protein At3g12770-like [Zingiber officinale]KAG6490217.1 hypothetical protein ZIOFF_051502 [Zingiber officinale]